MKFSARLFATQIFYLALIGATLLMTSAARAADIVAGPMVGHVTDHSARIWLQLAMSQEVALDCYDISNDEEVCSVSMVAQGPSPFTADIALSNLKPNKSYRIQVRLDGVPAALGKPDCVIRTNPPVGQESVMTVGFGSCIDLGANGSKRLPIFKAIKEANPRAFLFLGNSTYLPEKMPDFDHSGRRAFRFIADAQSETRKLPDLQTLFRTTPCYAAWNDRDFGPPDSDKTWEFSVDSWSAFQRFWVNPAWGTTKDYGCYCSFTLGDADFFMLDSRMHRDPAVPAQAAGEERPVRSMLGAAQLEWLKQGLMKSSANFKVIACGSQLLGNDLPAAGSAAGTTLRADTWAAFQPEQGDFLRWLGTQGISGVIFITGTNRGYGELTTVAAKDSPTHYPLVELTSSALAGKFVTAEAANATTNPARASGPVVDNNFGTLDFIGQRDHRIVTLRLHDQNGTRIEQILSLSQLQSN